MAFHGSHRIRPNARCEQPSSLVFVAIETLAEPDRYNPNKSWHQLRLGVAVGCRWNVKESSRRTVFRFTTAVEFWEWLRQRLSRRKPTWVFIHNGHLFATILNLWSLIDNQFFWLHRNAKDGKCHCLEQQPRVKCWHGICTIDSIPWIVQVDSQFGRVNFVDTNNYMRESIKSLGRSLQHYHIDLAGDGVTEEDHFTAVERDCEIIERSITGLMREWRQINGGNWKLTASSLAMTYFQHRHADKLPYIHTNIHAKKLEREAYFGGQISAWFRGEVVDETDAYAVACHERLNLKIPVHWSAVYELDVRSLYPSVMARHQFPVKIIGYKNYAHLDYAAEIINRYYCVADVMVRVVGDGFPRRAGDTTVYPEGIYSARLCQPELYRAFERGQILAVSRIAWYETAEIFTPFVTEWWARRQKAIEECDGVKDRLCKMIMNSLFGKFGQRAPLWVQRPDQTPPEPWCLWYGPKIGERGLTRHRAIGWQDYSLEGEPDGPNTFTAISAFVTSYGREYMRGIRSLCPPRSVLYQHTDSMIVTQEGLDAIDKAGLIRHNELGYFKPPFKIQHCIIRGPNNITINGVDKVSGVGNSASHTDKHGNELPDAEWVVKRVERLSELLNPRRVIDGTIGVTQSFLCKPPNPGGMVEDDGYNSGWWHYAPII